MNRKVSRLIWRKIVYAQTELEKLMERNQLEIKMVGEKTVIKEDRLERISLRQNRFAKKRSH